MKNFLSKKAPEPVGYYPHAKKVGNLFFCLGLALGFWVQKGYSGVNFK